MLTPGPPGMVGTMEIRIWLDRADPPAGRLQVLPRSERPDGAHGEEGIGFAGWLGLLRALEEVVTSPGDRD
jgi:hypothetical protein